MRHTMRFIFVMVFSTPFARAGEPTGPSPGARVLNRWLGTWECRAVFKPAAWTPVEQQVTEVKTCRWILGGKFLEERGRSEKPKREFRFLCCYDPKGGGYRGWLFTSEGNTTVFTGTWDEGTTTMVWRWKVGLDANGKMMSRFVGRDRYEVTGIVKDRAGKVLMDFQTEHVRVQE